MLTAAAGLAPAPASAAPDAVISGRVTDSDGRPIKDVAIDLYDGPDASYETVTDADGRYSLGHLYAPERYSIAAEYRGSSPTGYVSTGDDVELEPGQHYDFSPVLQQGGGLSGKAIDTHGRPIEDGFVGADGDTDRTGADGSYALHNIRPGAREVCFSGPIPFPPSAPVTTYRQKCVEGVPVVAGQVRTVSARLVANPSINGTVTDTAGHPVKDLSIDVFARYGLKPEVSEYLSNSSGTPTTDYRVGPVTTGDKVVCFSSSDTSAAAPYGYAMQCWNNRPPDNTATPVTVHAEEQVSSIDARLSPTGGAASGVVRASDGRAVAYARVQILPASGGYRMSSYSHDGIIPQVNGLAPGRYKVCTQPGYTNTYYVNGDPAPPGGFVPACSSTPFTITARGLTTGVVAPVIAGSLIAGRVTNESGKAVAGVRVVLRDSTVHSYVFTTGLGSASDRFRFTGVKPGTYTVCYDASRTDYASGCFANDPKHRPATQPSKLVIPEGSTTKNIDVRLPRRVTN